MEMFAVNFFYHTTLYYVIINRIYIYRHLAIMFKVDLIVEALQKSQSNLDTISVLNIPLNFTDKTKSFDIRTRIFLNILNAKCFVFLIYSFKSVIFLAKKKTLYCSNFNFLNKYLITIENVGTRTQSKSDIY